jgi:single-strand DNA-binding protein
VTSPFKHENIIKIAGVLGAQPELRLTSGGNAVATLIVYTNYLVRNDDGSTRQESERHRVIVWGMHAEKAARLLRKGSKVRIPGTDDRVDLEGQADRRHALWRGDCRPDTGLPGRE